MAGHGTDLPADHRATPAYRRSGSRVPLCSDARRRGSPIPALEAVDLVLRRVGRRAILAKTLTGRQILAVPQRPGAGELRALGGVELGVVVDEDTIEDDQLGGNRST